MRLTILLICIASICQAQVNVNARAYRIVNSDSTHGEVDGTEYKTSAGKYRYKENGVWKYRASRADLSVYGVSTQIPFVNTSNTNFLYSSDISYDDTDNIFKASCESCSIIGTGSREATVMIGEGHVINGTANIRWSTMLGEVNTISSTSTGIIHNAHISGNSNLITNTSAQSLFNPNIWGGALNTIQATTGAITSVGQTSIIGCRECLSTDANVSMNMGYRGEITGWGGFVHGYATTYTGVSHTGTVQRVLSSGKHAINISANSASSIVGEGSLGDYGAIIGGYDHNIPATSPQSAIIGGSGIKARASDPNQVYVPNLNITSTLVYKDTAAQVLVIDATTKQIKRRHASSFGSITSTQVGYGSGSNTLTSEAAFTYDAGNNRLTVDEISSPTFGIRIAGTGQLSMTPGVNTFTSGKTRFTSDATNAAANIIPATGTPSSQTNGDLWYDDTGTDRLMARINGADVSLGAIGGTIAATEVGFGSALNTLASDADLTFTGGNTLNATNAVISTALTNSALTSTRIPVIGTAGLFGDDADLTFTGGNTLNSTNATVATNLTLSSATSGRMAFHTTGGLFTTDADLTFNGIGNILTIGSIAVGNGAISTNDGTVLTVGSGSTGNITIDPASTVYVNGDVGIGKPTPTYQLHITGLTDNENDLLVEDVDGDDLFSITSDALVDTGIITLGRTTPGVVTTVVNGGINNNGSALKHSRVAFTTVTANTCANTVVTWTTAFANTSYTPVVTIEDLSGAVNGRASISAKTTSSITIQVCAGSSDISGTLNVIAIHD